MSDMSEYDFGISKIEYADLGNIQWRSEIGEFRIPPNSIIKVTLTLIHQSGTSRPARDWSKSPIWFRTNKDQQFLVIELDSPQENAGKPRFYLHHLEFVDQHGIAFLPTISHSVHGGGHHPGRPANETFSEHTNSLTLNLAFPGSGTPNSFRFKLWASDREINGRLVDGDPLVGNDPPPPH